MSVEYPANHLSKQPLTKTQHPSSQPRTIDEPSTSATSAIALSVEDLDPETNDESAILTVEDVETMFENYISSPTPPPAVDFGSTQDTETDNSKSEEIGLS
ncbi:MAG: hypothetical protein M1824_001559 [Vezdaea acicularis]|nr:MAG: hypothetical protein M1824_001559 [Vezdaea acicularis]